MMNSPKSPSSKDDTPHTHTHKHIAKKPHKTGVAHGFDDDGLKKVEQKMDKFVQQQDAFLHNLDNFLKKL